MSNQLASLERSSGAAFKPRHIDLKIKTDWNNYSQLTKDLQRSGYGEQGKAVILPLSVNEGKISKHLYDKHKFNVTVSTRISYHRFIGDQRDEMCKKTLFTKDIPLNSVSIIIPFHNEHISTIVRTVVSVVNQSPEKLLREIILVDDRSTESELETLKKYISRNNLIKVRLLKNKRRLGLISSRIAGADNSTGKFLVFLDSHVEVNHNYLPPLLESILMDPKTIACPVVDVIDRHDFRVRRIQYERNGFQWDMQNEHLQIFPRDEKNLPSPFPTPVMLGCAFAIGRDWWERIGKFDSGLDLWGGEQYEICFKSWMCGGRVVNVPCSRVAHLFRNRLPYKVGEAYDRNIKRLALVWMDEYKEYVFQRLPGVRDANSGGLSKQYALRQKLHCRDFDWYMNTIAPDILFNWPVMEPTPFAWGPLRLRSRPQLCLNFSSKDDKLDKAYLEKCDKVSANFEFIFSWRKVIQEKNGIRCLETRTENILSVHYFRLNATQQQFVWDRDHGWIISLHSGQCLHFEEDDLSLDMRPCLKSSSFFWSFDFYNATLLDSEWKMAKPQLSNKFHIVPS